MPRLWLRKVFPRVIFLNRNVPEKRYSMFRDKEALNELPENSTDIFQRNILDRYLHRPDSNFQHNKHAQTDKLCFAEFLYYYVQPKLRLSTNNDSQPVVLSDELMETNHDDGQFINIVPLMPSEEKLKCRKVTAVLRYHAPNVNKHLEQYAHHLLFSFYLF